MQRNTKKGFTIVELVIVIAVIAILAAVLIPTFSNIIKKANDSSDLQTARNIMIEFVAQENAQVPTEYYVQIDGDTAGTYKYFKVSNGELGKTAEASAPAVGKIIVIDSGETVTTSAVTE